MAFGGTVKLTGESEYKKALADITSNLKVLNSEMKVVSSTYDKNNASVENLQSTNQTLNKKLEEQKEKVNILKNALENAKKETGENSETTKKWQVELNKAQAEVNETTKKIDENTDTIKKMEKANVSNTKELKEFEEQERKAGDGALKLGDIIKANLISEGIMAGIKGLGSAMKSVGSTLVNLGKQAIDSFGEYEQLVGGVDTLFGEAGKKVQEYANNAYKTAGLSSNQYMETVTSFSASMIASLNGDTAKASEVSNRAIIDMSDNANKMGTSMESIQNAYQGFAKQNYTMLDNLKLGYGGTKTEMQRLIADASKMTAVQKELGVTVDANDMSFANIANAISVVQKNMGIAGATSKEASTTMQGSVSAMKASWQNLITGIADENANFEQLVNNLIESIVGTDGEGGIIANFLPRIATAVNGIGQLVVSLGDKLLPQVVGIVTDLLGNILENINTNIGIIISAGERIIETLLNAIMTHSGDIVNIVIKLVNWLVQAVLESLPMLLKAVLDVAVSVINGLAEIIPEILDTIVEIIPELITTILDALPLLIEAIISVVMGIVDSLPYVITTLIEALPTIIQGIIDALLKAIPLLIDAGIELLMSIVEAIPTILDALIEALPTIINTIIDGLLDAIPMLLQGAIQLLMAIIQAIPTIISVLVEDIPNIVTTIINALLSRLPDLIMGAVQLFMGIIEAIPMIIKELIKSLPQIVTTIVKSLGDGIGKVAEIGKNLVQGLWNGISNATQWVLDKIKGFGKSILNGIKSIFGIHSPSKVFKDEVGKNLALGLGEGFSDTMAEVSADMQGAIPTEFDTNINANYGASSQGSTYDMMVSAFKQALTEVKVVMNNREMGAFVTNTIERVVYA